MESTLVAGITAGAVAATFLNVGKGIQKMKVEVLKKGLKAFNKENKRDLRIWIVGFLMTTAASGFFSYALKLTDKAGIVSAMGGLGIVGLVIFAVLVLKERFGPREQIGTAAVILGTVLISYFNRPIPFDPNYPLARLFTVAGIILGALILLCLFAWKTNKMFSLIFGAAAGTCIGISMILGDLALIWAGNDFIGQLKNPFPYIAIFIGTCALILTQFAFFRGRAMVIVPTINSFLIASPPLIEYIVLGTKLAPMQIVGLGVIVLGVVVLTTTSEGIRAK